MHGFPKQTFGSIEMRERISSVVMSSLDASVIHVQVRQIPRDASFP
jgi:hypothetical protein